MDGQRVDKSSPQLSGKLKAWIAAFLKLFNPGIHVNNATLSESCIISSTVNSSTLSESEINSAIDIEQNQMEKQNYVTTLFLDVGGVMLTDGWDRNSRAAASKLFKIDHQEMEERHHLNFETYELGRMSLNQYLERVIFYESRSFSKDDFTAFMYKQSLSFTNMINFFIHLKEKYKLKIAVISNEGQELNEYRIRNFKLNEFVDFFISSSFVQLRKPDLSIFRMALNIAQVKASESIYIDNQPLFVSIAEEFGMKGIVHKNYNSTVEEIARYGLII